MVYKFKVTEDGTNGIPSDPTPVEKASAETGTIKHKLELGVFEILSNPVLAEICKDGPLCIEKDTNGYDLYLGYATNISRNKVLCFFSCFEKEKNSDEMRYATVSRGNLSFIQHTVISKGKVATYEELYGKVNWSIHKKRQEAITAPTNSNLQETLSKEVEQK